MSAGRARGRGTVALLLSSVFPGLGQLYNRQPTKGAVFLALGAVLSWLVASAVPLDPLEMLDHGLGLRATLAVVALLAVWLWSLVDAWRGAAAR